MAENKEHVVLIVTLNSENPVIDELVNFIKSKGFKAELHCDENRIDKTTKTFKVISST